MNSQPPALSTPSAVRKQRILLVDTYAAKRDLRAGILRKLGIEVDCAADISEARSLWRADSYNLVLVDARKDSSDLEGFRAEIQSAKPPQRVAFLVGKPEYLAALPCFDSGIPAPKANLDTPLGKVVTGLFLAACESLPRRWGFQEAAWRIAATRSLKDPRPDQPRADGKRLPWSWAEAVKHHSKSSPLGSGPSTDSTQKEIA